MAPGNSPTNSRKTAKAGCMKPRLPDLTRADVDRGLRKSVTLNFRLTPAEKESLRRTAASLKMSISEYVLKAHDLVSRKLRR